MSNVIAEIHDGEHDAILSAVSQAVTARRKYLDGKKGLENIAKLTPGTRVVLCGNLRPKYLLGARGVVLDEAARKSGSLMVELDLAQGRFDKVVGVPATCLRSES